MLCSCSILHNIIVVLISIFLTVVANEHDDGSWTNVFLPEFTIENHLQTFQDNIFGWCKKELDRINNNDALKEIRSRAPMHETLQLMDQNNLLFENLKASQVNKFPILNCHFYP